MAGKNSTLILTVDLDCYICTKKIKKILIKLQDREQIQSISFDEKNNVVTISGPFDPHKLKKKLLCKAGKVIKEIKIKEEEKKLPAPEKPNPPEPEKPKPSQPAKEKETPKEEKPKEKEKPKEEDKPKEKEKPKPSEPEKAKPKPPPKEQEPEPIKAVPVPVYWPAGPVGPVMPVCCWRPWYDEFYCGGRRCYSCGMFYGSSVPPPPPSGSTCQFFCEEDPSCIIM